jgi:hypothetical protein
MWALTMWGWRAGVVFMAYEGTGRAGEGMLVWVEKTGRTRFVLC